MATYKPLQSISLTSNTSSITFSGIDQAYTDLIIIPTFTPTSDGMDVYLTFNGDSSSGLYSKTHLAGYGTSSIGSTRFTGQNRIASYWQVGPGNVRPSRIHYSIMSYANNTNHKIILAKASAFQTGAQEVNTFSGLWRNTAPITSLTLTASTGSFAAGSKFDMYGIKSGAPQALGGDVVATDGNYWYHAFRTTGTFTPQRNLTADVLQIAGGGGGGYTFNGGAGGGGAGGVFYATAQSLISTNYAVTVGAGGPQIYEGTLANGNDSQFGSLTLAKGGGQGGRQYGGGFPGANGGSGGGGGGSPVTAGGSSTQTGTGGTGYGNAGGGGASTQNGGGGGGSGAAGVSGASGGHGGAGLNTWSAWASATSTGVSGFYAGGGGGNPSGSAGSGGAGTVGVAGVANTGSGGGAGSNTGSGATGGSGIVIVRYPV
jgi:hypothetical protein